MSICKGKVSIYFILLNGKRIHYKSFAINDLNRLRWKKNILIFLKNWDTKSKYIVDLKDGLYSINTNLIEGVFVNNIDALNKNVEKNKTSEAA